MEHDMDGMHLSDPDMDVIPRKWLEVVVHFLSGFRNDTVDFGRPHLRPSVEGVYPLFVVLYAALVICGTASNVALLFAVLSPRAASAPGGVSHQGRRRSDLEAPPLTVSGSSPRVQQAAVADHGGVAQMGGGSRRGREPRRSVGGGGREVGRSARRDARDPTLCFLANVAVADAVKCLMVLPVSLLVLLVQNWVFGSFLCFFLPMMQDIPIHVTMLSFLLIAADRHRLLMDPMKPRLPPLFCSLAAWLLAICIVLPYPIYTTYLDLGEFKKEQFEGVGICAVNLGDDLQEYMRGLFIAMYVLPLAVIAFLYVRVSRELKVLREGAEESAALAARNPVGPGGLRVASRGPTPIGSHHSPRDLQTRGPRADIGLSSSSCAVSGDLESGREALTLAGMSAGVGERGGSRGGSTRGSHRGGDVGRGCWEDEVDTETEPEVDVRREQRTQKYLIAMVVVFAVCLFPLMVLRLAKLALTETYENTGHFDIAFITFVWVAFLPTLSTPGLYYAWSLSSATKERLLEYFRFSRQDGSEDEDEDEEDEEGSEREGGGGGRGSGCAALLLGRRRGSRRRRRDVCRLTRQQPHHGGTPASDSSTLGLSNVAFTTHPPPTTAASGTYPVVLPETNMVEALGGGGGMDTVLGTADDVMGSPFGKGSFS